MIVGVFDDQLCTFIFAVLLVMFY